MMKKIFVTVVIAICALGISAAQDLEKVTETFNSAATMLDGGNKADAIGMFESALTQATALGESGNEIAGQCKDILPKLCLSLGKEKAADKDFTSAIQIVKKAIKLATDFNNAEAVETAKDVLSQVMSAKVSSLLSADDIAGAVVAAKEAVAENPTNGGAQLLLGQVLSKAGKIDEAIPAFEKAMENGENEAAAKQLSNVYVKKAAACQKAKDLKGALAAAQKSTEYVDNATAQKIIGLSAIGLKQNKTAADALEAYLAMSPNAKDKAQITYQLGTALMGAGNNAKACGYFKQIAQDAKWGEGARYQIAQLKCK